VENGFESPLDELERTAAGEIPAYKSANQELAATLQNLRRIEQHMKGEMSCNVCGEITGVLWVKSLTVIAGVTYKHVGYSFSVAKTNIL